MLPINQILVSALLLIALCSNQSLGLSDRFERYGYQKLARPESTVTQVEQQQAQLLLAEPKDGNTVGHSSVQRQAASLTLGHFPRAPNVKPANNQIQAVKFHPATSASALQHANLMRDTGSHSVSSDHAAPWANEFGSLKFTDQHLLGAAPLAQSPNRLIHNGVSLTNTPSTLELALRQVSSDESVFQPSPPMIAVGHQHSFDWFTQAPVERHSFPGQHRRLGASAAFEQNNQTNSESNEISATAFVSSSAMPATTTTTTINELLVRNVSNEVEPLVVDHGQSAPDLHDYSHEAQQKQLLQPKDSQTNVSNPIEFNNQVIYEGPVTPPPSGADYHWSSSSPDRLPSENGISTHGDSFNNDNNRNNNNHSNEYANTNAWWALGVGEEFQRASNLTRANYREYCDKSPLLNGNRQRSLCRLHSRVMPTVARGLRMAIEECQRRFAFSRWNCSVILSSASSLSVKSIQSLDADNDLEHLPPRQLFGDVMRHPNRERSFLNAIFAAALAHSMTKACRQGELPEECGCDRRIKSNRKGRIEWIGCSDDIDYGAKFSRDFTDNFDTNEPDATKTIYLHNSEVGRRVFKAITDITCGCLNGESGQCETKRCWKQIGSFSDVVDQIMDRYESATHVQRSNKDPQKLRPVRRGVRKPKRKDLVYIDDSPDYCHQDLRIGVLGTQNRVCNSTSQGPDSCSILCCGRGFQNVVEHIEEDCNCKFVWCCQVKCDKCSRYVTSAVCN